MKRTIQIILILYVFYMGTSYASKPYEFSISKVSIRDTSRFEKDLTFNLYYLGKKKMNSNQIKDYLEKIDLIKEEKELFIKKTDRTNEFGLVNVSVDKAGMYLIVDNNDGSDKNYSRKNSALVYLPMDKGHKIILKACGLPEDIEYEDKTKEYELRDKDEKKYKDQVKTGDYFIKYMINIFLISLILLILFRKIEKE